MADYPTTPFERAVERAIAQENADPQGLPEEIVTGMERDVLDNPEKYPELHRLLTDPEHRAQRLAEGPR